MERVRAHTMWTAYHMDVKRTVRQMYCLLAELDASNTRVENGDCEIGRRRNGVESFQ